MVGLKAGFTNNKGASRIALESDHGGIERRSKSMRAFESVELESDHGGIERKNRRKNLSENGYVRIRSWWD